MECQAPADEDGAIMPAMKICSLLAVVALTACAHHDGGGDIKDATLTIDPPSSEVQITNGEPAHVTFTAKLTFPDGTVKDVTADTLFGLDANYGTFDGATLAITTAGKAQVYGTYQDKIDDAEVIARLNSVRVDPSLPASTPEIFNGTEDASLAPTLVYPASDAVMPRNLGDFEIHWTDAHANNVFEVSLHTDYADVKVYVPGNNGLPVGPTPSWMAFESSEWLAAVGVEKRVTYRVRGANTAAPGKVGAAAAPQSVQLSNERMEGGLYYWASAASDSIIGVFRHDMAKPGTRAEEFMTNKQAGRCVACHVLSRDGTKMAITFDGGGKPATMVDVATAKLAPSAASWNFGTFTPDNKQFLAVFSGVLTVRDPDTQGVLATMTSSAARVTHPDLSPDGTKLVYVRFAADSDWDFATGAIYTRTYNRGTREFGPEVKLVEDGKNNFYPSWSPDGAWVVFSKNDAGRSYDDANSTTWVVKGDGSAPPVQLAKANSTLGITNSWARWAPFGQTLGADNEQMYWITFASKRDFGVRQRNSGLDQRPHDGKPGKTAQLWMTPFLADRAAAGQDPSANAFRLPFQNLDSSNHIAQWTERVVIIE
jgi:hypothetical protein